MSHIAVDIALQFELEPESLMRQMNLEVQDGPDGGIPLNLGSIPHVTLAMSFVPVTELASIRKELAKFPEEMEVVISGTHLRQEEGKRDLLSLEVLRTPELLQLHREAFEILNPYMDIVGVRAGFHESERIGVSTVAYVNRFKEYSNDQYWPHVTIGYGSEALEWKGPEKLKGRVKLFHLGPHCSCWEF